MSVKSNHVVPWGVLIYGEREREKDSEQTYVFRILDLWTRTAIQYLLLKHVETHSYENLWMAHFVHEGPLVSPV